MFIRRLLIVIVLLLSAASAQNSKGSLQGEVQDPSGARIPSAKVTLSDPQISFSRTVSTDARGEFRFDQLTPGDYTLTVSARSMGFGDSSSPVHIELDTVRDVMVSMKLAKGTAVIVDEASASPSVTTQTFDPSETVQHAVITSDNLKEIPLAARSFANIAYMAPGTQPVEPSDPTKARITAVAFGGSSGLNVQLSLDGADNTDDYIGGFLQNFSPDAIQEFSVQTAGEYAETGRTVGGSVSIATKSGGNNFHGTEAFYERGSGLNARFPIDNPDSQPKQPFSRQNYVATLGGPIKRDRLFFFASVEGVHENASINYSPDSLAEFNALASLASAGLIPGVSSIPVDPYTRVPFKDLLTDLRFDFRQSDASYWTLRASADNYITDNNLVQQGTMGSTGVTTHGNYYNVALMNQYTFSPRWLGSLTIATSILNNRQARNTDLGFALAFPFSATASTISGFETFGDQQFVTGITAFPVSRKQEKYQLRYDLTHANGAHSHRFGIDFIHEPVLSGALSGTAENLTIFPLNPTDYAANHAQFTADLTCGATATPGTECVSTPAGDGGFAQNVQRLGLYAQDSWKVTEHVTINYGLRYDTTFGLFQASGRSQLENPALLTLNALQIPLVKGAPHDYHKQFAPRLGIAWSPSRSERLIFRAGAGVYWNDLAQNGWVAAFQSVNAAPAPCAAPGDAGCIPGAASGGAGALIAPDYHTPYALHFTGGMKFVFNRQWSLAADYVHEQGNHAYRAYNYTPGYNLFSPLFTQDVATQQANVPGITVFRSDNRSRYDALSIRLQGNVKRLDLSANYTLASAKTYGCVVGELFDYVNGVCDPLHAFRPSDYGPSGEDVRHRLVLIGVLRAPGGFELSTLTQLESARPITLSTPVDTLGTGDPTNARAVINGRETSLDEFRGTPFMQVDLRVARPFKFGENKRLTPFVEMFNLLNRNNPGNNYISDISALPDPVNNLANATQICGTGGCVPITNPKQLLVPAGALGDFFGPGTTVGIPFAAQVGVRFTF